MNRCAVHRLTLPDYQIFESLLQKYQQGKPLGLFVKSWKRYPSEGPAATSLFPSSLSVYLSKLSINRLARSAAFSFHSAGFA